MRVLQINRAVWACGIFQKNLSYIWTFERVDAVLEWHAIDKKTSVFGLATQRDRPTGDCKDPVLYVDVVNAPLKIFRASRQVDLL